MLEGGQGGVFALLEKNVRMSGYSDEAMIWGLWGTAGSVENQERYLQDHGIEGEGGKELGGESSHAAKIIFLSTDFLSRHKNNQQELNEWAAAGSSLDVTSSEKQIDWHSKSDGNPASKDTSCSRNEFGVFAYDHLKDACVLSISLSVLWYLSQLVTEKQK